MNPLNKRFFAFFMPVFMIAAANAQQIHLSDIQSLYSADSAGFRNACKTNDFVRERSHDNDSSYSLSCYADTGKAGFARTFDKYANFPGHQIHTLTYFMGARTDDFQQLEKEIKSAGFKFKQHRTTKLPGDYLNDSDVYEKDLEMVSLQTQSKSGTFTGYSLTYFRLNKKDS